MTKHTVLNNKGRPKNLHPFNEVDTIPHILTVTNLNFVATKRILSAIKLARQFDLKIRRMSYYHSQIYDQVSIQSKC